MFFVTAEIRYDTENLFEKNYEIDAKKCVKWIFKSLLVF